MSLSHVTVTEVPHVPHHVVCDVATINLSHSINKVLHSSTRNRQSAAAAAAAE
jgi:hypothetical protein